MPSSICFLTSPGAPTRSRRTENVARSLDRRRDDEVEQAVEILVIRHDDEAAARQAVEQRRDHVVGELVEVGVGVERRLFPAVGAGGVDAQRLDQLGTIGVPELARGAGEGRHRPFRDVVLDRERELLIGAAAAGNGDEARRARGRRRCGAPRWSCRAPGARCRCGSRWCRARGSGLVLAHHGRDPLQHVVARHHRCRGGDDQPVRGEVVIVRARGASWCRR